MVMTSAVQSAPPAFPSPTTPSPSPPVSQPTPHANSAPFHARRLQSQMAHEALLRLHDDEIMMLESVKKFAVQKTTYDREYAKKVLDLCAHARKSLSSLDGAEISFPLFGAWRVFLHETERVAELTRANADEAGLRLTDILGAVVGEKKSAKRKYCDARHALEVEATRAADLVNGQRHEYAKLVAQNRVVREKYEDLFRRNKTPASRKFVDAKAKYRKSSARLHALHNEHVLAIEDANRWERQRRERLGPALLELHHASQVDLAARVKDALLELRRCGDTTAPKFSEAQRSIADALDGLAPRDSYSAFAQLHVKDPEAPAPQSFDAALLRDYQGTLAEGKIAVDDLTIDALRDKLKTLTENRRAFATHVEKKLKALEDMEAAMTMTTQQTQTQLQQQQHRREPSATPPSILNGHSLFSSRRPTTSSMENLLQSSSDNGVALADSPVDAAAADALNGNLDPSTCNGRPEPDCIAVPSASLRPLSGATLIIQTDADFESTTTTTKPNEDVVVVVSSNNNDDFSSSRPRPPPPQSLPSPISSDTLTPSTPSSAPQPDLLPTTPSTSSNGGSPSRGLTADGAFVIANANASLSDDDAAALRRRSNDAGELHQAAARQLRHDLERLRCDEERCEAKLELLREALSSLAVEDGEGSAEIPRAIPVDDAGTGESSASSSHIATSPFKKNNKNRLTKIFKGRAPDPVPPPPPDYPNEEAGDGAALAVPAVVNGGSAANSDTSSENTGGGSAGGSVGGAAVANADSTSLQNVGSVDPPAPAATAQLQRYTESYMDVDAGHRVSRVRAPSLVSAVSSLDAGPSSSQFPATLTPVGEDPGGAQSPALSVAPSSRFSRASSSAGMTRSVSRHSVTLDTASLEEEEWFHGILPRDEVVRLLSDNGDFLVRETTKNGKKNIVLSVAWNGHKHFMVQKTGEGKFRFEGLAFPTVQELIINQWESRGAVTVKSGAVLQRPIPRMDWEIRNDDIVLREKIGNGNFGEVYKGVLNTTGQDVAIKTCKINLPEDQKKKFLQEGSILKQYNHPNIVKLIGIAAQRQPIMIVMELVDGGSLLSFLRKHGGKQSQKTLVRMCADAAAGMEYLESVKCIHRDLAARNCLVGNSEDREAETPGGAGKIVKISDFGMSRENEIYECSDGMKQIPIKWTAPEALNWGRYTSLCDVWSFGILMWEIFSHGSTPYPGWPNPRAREEVERGYRMPAPEGTPDKMYQLMRRCWEYEAEDRPHFDHIHAEIKGILEAVS